ncbi:MAG: TIGR01777 family oxidoreductase [Phycisphaeraceae bacterium]
MATSPSRVILAGGSGFLGIHLARHLQHAGYAIMVLSRRATDSEQEECVRWVRWDGRTLGPWAEELEGTAALINLAGRNVNCRYTAGNRRAILHSRLDSVHVLDQAVQRCQTPPPVWVQMSTLAIYGDRGDEVLDEDSSTGQRFSPDVARAWEQAAIDAEAEGARKVLLRASFVLGTDGGALPTLARLVKLGLGGSVGSGRQFYSWIHVRDLCRIVQQAIAQPSMSGIYNATSPQPVRNREFMHQLRRVLHRPWSPPAPAWAVRLGCVLMRSEPELALRSRYGVPRRLAEMGFAFDYPDLLTALADLYGPSSVTNQPTTTAADKRSQKEATL